MRRSPRWLPVLLCAVVLPVGPVPVALGSGGAAWQAQSVAQPSIFTPGANAQYAVVVRNVGSVASGGVVVVRDTLPKGITMTAGNPGTYDGVLMEREIGVFVGYGGEGGCGGGAVVVCRFEGVVPAGALLELSVPVYVSPQAAAVGGNVVEVEGGGGASARSPASLTRVEASPSPSFGLSSFAAEAVGPDGDSYTQAGGHPSLFTNTIDPDTRLLPGETAPWSDGYGPVAVQEPKEQTIDLPAGLVGDPLAAEHCPASAIAEESVKEVGRGLKLCPAGSRVGYATVEYNGGVLHQIVPLFNVMPEGDYPAEFAFEFSNEVIVLDARLLPSSTGYVLSTALAFTPRVTTLFRIDGVSISLFGSPTERDGAGNGEAFFRAPTDCGAGPLSARLETNPWVEPGDWQTAQTPVFEAASNQGVTGCGLLRFEPSVQVTPGQSRVDAPSGYGVDLRVPQTPNVPGRLATPDLKNAVVSFPAGVSISPSAANGLVACQASGPEGIDMGANDVVDADRVAQEDGVRVGGEVQEGEVFADDGLVHAAPGHCPEASQVGDVEVRTPLLPEPLHGHVFVAAPACGGAGQPECSSRSAEDGELFGLYAEVSGSGVIVKFKLHTSVNPVTGQITTTMTEGPQMPYSALVTLDGGQRSPLATPQACGSFTASSDLTPWSTPYTPDATPASTFAIGGCPPGGMPFAPVLVAGTTSRGAGGYAPLTATFTRQDGEQDLRGIQVTLPPGLLAKLEGVAECGETEVQAAEHNTGGCPEASRLGIAITTAGAGDSPIYQSGPVYLTGPYDGAPFGLAVVVAANAGPFHLGNIVVRARIVVDPDTAQVTAISNPLPQTIDGVPLRIKTVNVKLDRQEFMFNPTNCSQQHITGILTSTQGTQTAVASPFAVQGCRNLAFEPGFSVSTQAKTSKRDGASLHVKLAFPHAGPQGEGQGGEANTASVKVTLPKALPARLTTLQKACSEAQFNTNPAGCPAASFIGRATAHTPILATTVTGPAILVSHGGAAFPDLVIVLQGQGVTVQLTGLTAIKHAITTSTFATVPDAPITGFELALPQGPYSALAAVLPAKARGSLCSAGLLMPTVITAQNGATVNQNTKIAPTGCPKPKKKAKTKKGKAKKK
jgi:uncharacterized repeat protein (TIGR01451 family)